MVDLFDKPFHGFVNFSHHVTSQGNSVDAIEKSALKLMKVPNLKVINDLTLMAPSSGIRHYLIAGHFNKSTEEKPCRTWLWVTAVEFKSHAHPALRVVMWNNLDKPGCNRIKPVYHWREVVTVTIKHLNNKNEKKKNNNNNKIRATKIISEKKKNTTTTKNTGELLHTWEIQEGRELYPRSRMSLLQYAVVHCVLFAAYVFQRCYRYFRR